MGEAYFQKSRSGHRPCFSNAFLKIGFVRWSVLRKMAKGLIYNRQFVF